MDPEARIDLRTATVVLMDPDMHSVDVMAQIMKGFGVVETHRCVTIEEAQEALSKRVDLVVIDPAVSEGRGYEFLHDLRRTKGSVNAFVPVILVSGHTPASEVTRGRDAGANYFVAKPVTPNVMLERIMFVARDRRPFIEHEGYIGPDRRFKFMGPPPGSEGRRQGDSTALSHGDGPNLSQDEVDAAFKPQRVDL